VSAPVTTREPVPAARETEVGSGRALSRWLWTGALGAAAAGALHIAVAVEHLEAGDLTVGFFLLTALAQLGLAAWLALSAVTRGWPDLRLVSLALLATVSLMAMYVVAHTTALLDAFAVPGHAGGHGGGTHVPGIDPVTGVDLSQGVPTRVNGQILSTGELPSAGHDPGALGPWTVAAEVVTLAALTALQPASWRRRTTNGVLLLGGLAWVLWFTGVLA
jgi:hypothetical protein